MRLIIAIILPVFLLSACESRNRDRSDLETFLMNLGQIVFDSAKESTRPAKDF